MNANGRQEKQEASSPSSGGVENRPKKVGDEALTKCRGFKSVVLDGQTASTPMALSSLPSNKAMGDKNYSSYDEFMNKA